MAGRAHVRVDPTVSSVSPAPHLGGFVHLDVLSDQTIYIQALKFGITFCIFERVQ